MKKLGLFFSLIVCISGLTGCDTITAVQPVPSGKTVKVGVIGPLSGPDKAWGKNGLAGIRTALALQPLLDNGDRIELVLEDDRNGPLLAQKALTKLVEEDKVSAILTMSVSSSVLGLVDLADSHKTPIFALTSTHPGVTEGNSYISQLIFDDEFQASVAALFTRDELLVDRSGVVMDEQNPHSAYLAEQFSAKFTSVGGVATVVEMTSDEKALEQHLQSLQLQGAELLYTPMDAEHVLTIARLLSGLNWRPLMMGGDGLQARILLQHKDAMHLVNGMLATDPYSSLQQTTAYGKKIEKIFKEQTDTQGTVITAQGAEGLSILVAAMNRCEDSGDRICINRQLRSTVDFTGLFSKISIRSDGKAERPVYLNKIDNNRLRLVVKVY